MKFRLFAALLIAVAPVAARAADEENPYKKVKVGEFATYKMTPRSPAWRSRGPSRRRSRPRTTRKPPSR